MTLIFLVEPKSSGERGKHVRRSSAQISQSSSRAGVDSGSSLWPRAREAINIQSTPSASILRFPIALSMCVKVTVPLACPDSQMGDKEMHPHVYPHVHRQHLSRCWLSTCHWWEGESRPICLSEGPRWARGWPGRLEHRKWGISRERATSPLSTQTYSMNGPYLHRAERGGWQGGHCLREIWP